MFCYAKPRGYDTCYRLYIAMSNQELIDAGTKRMDETDQAIERSKQVNYSEKCVFTQYF